MSWLDNLKDAGWINTLSGAKVNWYGGIPTAEDIAVSLCRTPLFVGQTSKFFSLAHHCLCVATRMPQLGIYGLLHEAEVAIVGDVPGPLKTNSHRRLEKILRDRIIVSFGIPPITPEIWEEVELYDQQNLAAVSRVLNLPDAEEIWPVSDPEDETCVEFMLTWYPPEQQLERNSNLARYFLQQVDYLKGLV